MTIEEKATAYADRYEAKPMAETAIRAYIAGATEALASQWVSVEERLPERGKDVLIYTSRGQIKMSCWRGLNDTIDNESRHKIWKWWGNTYPYVLYWMPIPEPPTKGGEE